MYAGRVNGRNELRRRWTGLVATALTGLSLSGCANFWEDVTSRDFEFKEMFSHPNPLQVLKDSNDGDKRARALRALREPKQQGGTDQDQEAVVKILTTAAVSEKQFLCRLSAIQALGHFQDPRALEAIENAFYNSTTFPPEMATRLQYQAMLSLGETGNPKAVEFLARVAKGVAAEGSEQEKQQVLDVRIAAARALGHFHDYPTAEALVRVYQNDKDVAVRDCARESFQACTGKEMPAEVKNWDGFLGDTKKEIELAGGIKKQKVLGLF